MTSFFEVCYAGLYDKPVQPDVPSGSEPRPIITVKRLISCPTYCSRLHVNQHMAEHLLPVLPESASIKVGRLLIEICLLSAARQWLHAALKMQDCLTLQFESVVCMYVLKIFYSSNFL